MVLIGLFSMKRTIVIMANSCPINTDKETDGFLAMAGGQVKGGEMNDIISKPPSKTLIATITAYTKKETCPDRKCIMANGKEAHIGAIACPRSLKLGQEVVIDKEYICSDRTSLKYDGRFDIWFGETEEDYKRALQFGKQLQVKIIIKEKI